MYNLHLVSAISSILFEEDPVNLRQCGVPLNEYDIEAEDIVQRIAEYKHGPMDLLTLSQICADVFDEWFTGGENPFTGRVYPKEPGTYKPENFTGISMKILDLYKDLK